MAGLVTVTDVMTPNDVGHQVGHAIKRARTERDMSQAALGDAVAELLPPEKPPASGKNPDRQGMVSKWENTGNLNVRQMVAVERVLALPPGELFRIAGYLGEGGLTIEDVIPAASDLTATDRDLLLGMYRRLKRQSRGQQLQR